MQGTGPLLPILERREEIEAALRRHRVVIICGETGSGKTTQIPQICLDMDARGGRGTRGIIGHTQPRRIAARAVAARIAQERGEVVGGVVGAKVRFQDQTSTRTKIKVMTDGVLLAELSSDPELSAYGTIIIDEAHERSLNIDFLLGYLKRLIERRKDLQVIITSATIDPRRFSEHFGGESAAPVLMVSGRTYPVEVRYEPPRSSSDDFDTVEAEAVADAVEELCVGARDGDVLVFLPGEKEIRQAGAVLAQRRVAADVLPLFSRLTNQEQDRIFDVSSGRRRVILATNVAETSLTVPGIRYVVDTGLARLNRYDPGRKVQRLELEQISRASADQRAGRCGRVSEGVCVRLYSEASYRSRSAFTAPEILRTSLAGAILRLKSLGGSVGAIEDFPFLDPPETAAVADGYETLFELGAIDAPGKSGALTEIGVKMARIPVDPRIARMLLAAEREGAVDEIVVLGAALSIQDPRERPLAKQEAADRAQAVFRHESSDFMTLLKVWDQYLHAADELSSGELAGWCRDHFLSAARMREWREMVRQLGDIASEIGVRGESQRAGEDAVHRALLTGLITNVACREGDGSFDYRGVRGNVVQIFPGSALFKKGPKWIMAAEVVKTTRLYARTLAKVDPAWIEELAGHMFRRQLTDPHLNSQTGMPCAWERLTLSGIVVVPRREAAIERVDPRVARGVFIREALAEARWELDAPFMVHNRAVLAAAERMEACLRRKGVRASAEKIAAWFEDRVPADVSGPESFERWRRKVEGAEPRILMLGMADVVEASAGQVDPAAFPERVVLAARAGDEIEASVTYALAPGKDEDGITFTVDLEGLGALEQERLDWAVEGVLGEVVQGLVKTLPKQVRGVVEAKGPVAEIAGGCAGVMAFGKGLLGVALSEAMEILHAITIDPSAWSTRGLPPHLRVRVKVVDEEGKTLGADRDLEVLKKRFEVKIRKARAARERAGFERLGLTSWDFGELAERVEVEADGQTRVVFPMVVDEGNSVSLTLGGSEDEAKRETPRGIRRLFALACREEVGYYLEALSNWGEMVRQFGALGSEAVLRDQLTCVIAERVFMEGLAPIRSEATFMERREEMWGKLSAVSREVGECVARMLEPRQRVAHRLSGGTPRLWATSVADLREQAAYLMPQGFLVKVPWEHLKNYPRYAEGMRQRLFALREDGSGVESAGLAKFEPYWKRFTGWVAGAMARQREAVEEGEKAQTAAAQGRTGKGPLPPPRRAGQRVNLDAGEWAIEQSNLGPAVWRYRWALEELRLSFLVQGAGANVTVKEVEELWAKVEGGGGPSKNKNRTSS